MIELADLIQTIVILIMGIALYRLVQTVDKRLKAERQKTEDSFQMANALRADLEQEVKQLRNKAGENNGRTT